MKLHCHGFTRIESYIFHHGVHGVPQRNTQILRCAQDDKNLTYPWKSA